MTHNQSHNRDSFPLWKVVRLDIQSLCNRNCHFCPRYNDRSGTRKDAFGKPVNIRMPSEQVYRLLDEISSLGFTGYIGFHRLSEPILDPRFMEFCQYARAKGMRISENSNGDYLLNNPQLCHDMDGLVNILVIGLYDYKNEAEKNAQITYWQKRFSKTEIRFSTPNKKAKIRQNSGLYEKRHKHEGILTHPCFRTANLLIRYDGNVSLCCEDDNCTFSLGNAFYKSLEEIWWSKKHIDIVQTLQKKRKRHHYTLCSNCYLPAYKKIPDSLTKVLHRQMEKR